MHNYIAHEIASLNEGNCLTLTGSANPTLNKQPIGMQLGHASIYIKIRQYKAFVIMDIVEHSS